MNRDLTIATTYNLKERSDKSPFAKGGFRGNVNILAIVKELNRFAFSLTSWRCFTKKKTVTYER